VIGREQQLERIEGLLESARGGRAGALVVVGEAGIGKTSLLDAAEAAAVGFERVRARGVESESTLGHAGLLQLLGPLRRHLDAIPEPQRRALDAALGWGSPEARGDRYLVAAATLSLLAVSAEQAPVLVVVDDLHWLDPESASSLLFAARRLEHDAVAVLLASRVGSPGGTALDGIESLPVAGLSSTEAQALFPPGTEEMVVARLVAATCGNPLALVEIAKRLSPAQRRGAAPLPDPLPAGVRLEAVYESVLSSLPPAPSQAVLLAAAARDDALDVVVAALQSQGFDPDKGLGEAERRGVLVVEPGVVRFRHPLLRSAVWARATPAQRRAAHAALAQVLSDNHRRARTWHRAEAATGRDGAVAAELESVADEDRARLGYAAASVALERAALLSEDSTLAAQRLVAAVEDAALAGDVTRARALVDRLLASDATDERIRGRALASLGILEQCTGSIPRAAQQLAEAARHTDGQLRVRVLAEVAMEQHRLGDYAGQCATADEIAAVADRADPHQLVLSLYFGGFSALVNGDHEHGRALLKDALELYATDPALADEPRYLVPALLATGWLGPTPTAARFFEDRLANARSRGALTVLVRALAMFAYGRAWLGDHAGAFADAGEAAELAVELGYVADAAPALEMLAWQHAARGAHDEAAAELEQATRTVERAGTASVAAHLAEARAFCALCRDDLDEVVVVLETRLAVDGGRGAMGEVLGVAPLLIEAYAALGRRADAARLADRFGAIAEPDRRTQALMARCRGLIADDDAIAVDAFEAALTAHTAAADPFERARTELLYGARMRRSGQRAAARQHLRTARDRFAAMDLTLWVKRATAELAATGETMRARGHVTDEPLTSQETRVALLVARGLTNREVAAALFLSPKTVEHHLSSVYRKRGLRSRTELARAFAGDSKTPETRMGSS
jgi:DNA-binding NarL/FixJ family response regulator